MPSYRLYRLDGAGKIMTADWLDAEADDDALRQANDRMDGNPFELWDRNRLIVSSREAPDEGAVPEPA